ncbi:pyruvate, water dikinase regulatory protein [Fluviispira vulneris]|uniref:pyruvate, water dikinase regulatory protein n=1 Tax=Fluviispira vulneris TaxID=2763012 RepID=UPI0016493B51|nr:pyruvate, water dikinase regulatory protein [Fluviispira vulneris]
MLKQTDTSVPNIFTVSDGTGETAISIVRAVRVQFDHADIHIERFNKIRRREMLEEILLNARNKKATVVATLVDPELRIFLISRSMQLGVKVVDVLFPLMETVSEQLGRRPSAIPGLLRQLDEGYFKRISAIEYTVRHDDGIISSDLSEADIVLIGVSRTSKTPLSMYLGHKGYKVANIPLVPGIEPPKELENIDQNKIIALIIDPTRLAEIRAARIEALGTDEIGDYADIEKIFEELEWSRKIFKRNKRWPVLDVTGKALEENSVEIEKIILSRFPELMDE